MSAFRAALVYALMLSPLAAVIALAQTMHTTSLSLPPALREWAYSQTTLAVAIAAVLGGLAEIWLAYNFHSQVSWLQPPKGFAGLASRALFSACSALMIVPFLVEVFLSQASFNKVLFFSFLFTTGAPQLVGALSRKFTQQAENAIDKQFGGGSSSGNETKAGQ